MTVNNLKFNKIIKPIRLVKVKHVQLLLVAGIYSVHFKPINILLQEVCKPESWLVIQIGTAPSLVKHVQHQ